MADFDIEFCPHCGDEINYTANTCSECGEDLPNGSCCLQQYPYQRYATYPRATEGTYGTTTEGD